MPRNHPANDATHHTDKHPKQDFQVERIAFFSDAVFAIAITLLIIEFKVPETTKETTRGELLHELLGLKYKFFALLVSFALIANYWMRHHVLFKYIHNYNRHVVVANLASLLPIIFFPFTTAFFYENNDYPEIVDIPLRLFMANNVLAGIGAYYFYWTTIKRFKEYAYPMEKNDQHEFERKLLTMTISFALVLLLSFFLPFTYAVFGLMPMAVLSLYERYFKKQPATSNQKINKSGNQEMN